MPVCRRLGRSRRARQGPCQPDQPPAPASCIRSAAGNQQGIAAARERIRVARSTPTRCSCFLHPQRTAIRVLTNCVAALDSCIRMRPSSASPQGELASVPDLHAEGHVAHVIACALRQTTCAPPATTSCRNRHHPRTAGPWGTEKMSAADLSADQSGMKHQLTST